VTKTSFLMAYKSALIREHEWARDPAHLNNYLNIVAAYVRHNMNSWIWDTPTTRAAWRAIGCKGRITFKGICALPDA